ncbi:MAG TPA: hypothetical protein DCO77_02465, partial [Nitrospiraceae bacterium]|nr:hypothetical protein [Nitrospiraceae bacterium]
MYHAKLLFFRTLFTLCALALFVGVHSGVLALLEPRIGAMGATVTSFGLIALFLFGTPLMKRVWKGMDALVLRHRDDFRTLLSDATHEVITILEWEELQRYIVELFKDTMAIEKGFLFLPEDDGTYRVCHSWGIEENATAHLRLPPHGAPWLESTGNAVFLSRSKATAQTNEVRAFLAVMEGIRVDLLLPFLRRHELMGFLALGPAAKGGFPVTGVVRPLEGFAEVAAVAIQNARLFREATRDRLTRLAHRRYFLTRVKEAMEGAKRYRYPLSILMVNIDNFREINSRQGHLVGDMILKEVAGELRSCFRETDIVARYGGDEFAVLLPETTGEDGLRVGERLWKRIEHLRPEGTDVTVSVGVGFFT